MDTTLEPMPAPSRPFISELIPQFIEHLCVEERRAGGRDASVVGAVGSLPGLEKTSRANPCDVFFYVGFFITIIRAVREAHEKFMKYE
jgi:hypothetical protein